MKIAIIGKSAFGADVFRRLLEAGHEVVVVCTEPDKNGRADLIALEAAKNGTPVLKTARWRRKNAATGKWEVIPEIFKEYATYGAELNVLPFCTQFIPQEVIEFPMHHSIIYHPSILPAHRGASAINWTLIGGDIEAGLTLFWADEGVDTGPILLQRKCLIEENDTVNSLYKRFLYPEGVKATVEAVNLIAAGNAPRITQPEEGATYEPYITAKPELAEIDWNSLGQRQLHNFIRGNDNVPGAWTTINGQKVTLLNCSLWKRFEVPGNSRSVVAEGIPGGIAWAHDKGLLFKAIDGKYINAENLRFEDGKTIKASQFGSTTEAEAKIELNDEEKQLVPRLKNAWKAIINMEVHDNTNFFDAGASSADLARMLEEVKTISKGVDLKNCEVYLAPTFGEFLNTLVKRLRGEDKPKLEFEKFEKEINNMKIEFPVQMFINGRFVNSESKRKMESIDPATEEVICQVPRASAKDVDWAVKCAEEAFNYGEWSRISARERGGLLFRLADLMEEHKEELATIESIDSGAVYTLALKTHVGMSIDVWRYFAGWCDKIQVFS